jgi:hypothetical protein
MESIRVRHSKAFSDIQRNHYQLITSADIPASGIWFTYPYPNFFVKRKLLIYIVIRHSVLDTVLACIQICRYYIAFMRLSKQYSPRLKSLRPPPSWVLSWLVQPICSSLDLQNKVNNDHEYAYDQSPVWFHPRIPTLTAFLLHALKGASGRTKNLFHVLYYIFIKHDFL